MHINFELLDVRAFLAVLDLGGFHRAAEALNLSQPALSRRIQSLEAAVGAPLLERTTRRVAATTVGRSFAPLARRLLDEFEETLLGMTGVGGRQTGQITIACVPTMRSISPAAILRSLSARSAAGTLPVTSAIRTWLPESSCETVAKCCRARTSVGAMSTA